MKVAWTLNKCKCSAETPCRAGNQSFAQRLMGLQTLRGAHPPTAPGFPSYRRMQENGILAFENFQRFFFVYLTPAFPY